MSGRSFTGIARQSIGVALSRDLLAALSSCPEEALHGSTEVNGHSPMSTEGNANLEENSDNPAGLIEVLTDAVRRRSWLLAKALETHPLDEALELARTAEAFITGSSTLAEATAIPPHLDNRTDRSSTRDTKRLKKRTPLTVPPEQREQLLQRLAHGARNAEVASEFGLSIKQVQGIRMGSAREITRIRDRARDDR
jgi:hypothetical protein